MKKSEDMQLLPQALNDHIKDVTNLSSNSEGDTKLLKESEIEEQLSRCICGNKPSNDEWVECNAHGIITSCAECSN